MSENPELAEGDEEMRRRRQAIERTLDGVDVPSADRMAALPREVWFGATGDVVREAHRLLAKKYKADNEDAQWEVEHAEFGPWTQQTVEAFQQEMGLPMSGQVDGATWLSLRTLDHH